MNKETRKVLSIHAFYLIFFIVPVSLIMLHFLNQNDFKDASVDFVSCNDLEDSFLKYLGFKDKKDCAMLNKYTFEDIANKCSEEFSIDGVDKSFYLKCIVNEIEIENLKLAKEHVLYMKNKIK